MILISSALTSEFENTVGLINNLSFFESYLTTTDVDPAPTPLVSFEINNENWKDAQKYFIKALNYHQQSQQKH